LKGNKEGNGNELKELKEKFIALCNIPKIIEEN
jgi:hypothetical protein